MGVSRSLSQLMRSAVESSTCSHRFRLITPANAPATHRNSTLLKPPRGTHHSSDITRLVIHPGIRLLSLPHPTKIPSCARPVVRESTSCNNRHSNSTSTFSPSTCTIHSTSSQTSSPHCSGSPAFSGITMFSFQSMKMGRRTRPRPCCGFLTR